MKPSAILPRIPIVLLMLLGLSCTKEDAPVEPTPDPIPVVGKSSFTKGPFTLTFTNNDPGFDTTIRSKMVKTFFIVYPEEVKRFNTNSKDTVRFFMDTAYAGVAATGGGKVTFSAAYFRSHSKDIDVVTHEVMHIVQSYPQYKPVWLVEGIADYARYVFGVNNANGGWSLPDYSPGQHYTDSYRITARFLVWLEKHTNKPIVDQLDASLRDETYYSTDIWEQITGKSLDALWNAYAADPAL